MTPKRTKNSKVTLLLCNDGGGKALLSYDISEKQFFITQKSRPKIRRISYLKLLTKSALFVCSITFPNYSHDASTTMHGQPDANNNITITLYKFQVPTERIGLQFVLTKLTMQKEAQLSGGRHNYATKQVAIKWTTPKVHFGRLLDRGQKT
jgi:hypothetical protein